MVKHAGQTTLYLTPIHGAKGKLLALIANILAALGHVRAVAEQLPRTERWKTFLDYVVARTLYLRLRGYRQISSWRWGNCRI